MNMLVPRYAPPFCRKNEAVGMSAHKGLKTRTRNLKHSYQAGLLFLCGLLFDYRKEQPKADIQRTTVGIIAMPVSRYAPSFSRKEK